MARRRAIQRFASKVLPLSSGGWLLKTDLFDEASGPHHHAAGWPNGIRFVGIDSDLRVVRLARVQLAAAGAATSVVVADVRHLPFATGSVQGALSLSTLDHFRTREEIDRSLRELSRVLGEDCRLCVTLDNPRNPEVALRRLLPSRLVSRLRADQFPLGETLRLEELTESLTRTGFLVEESEYLIHAPRYLAIRLASWLHAKRRSWMESLLRRAIQAWEAAGRLPSRRWTGHYVACIGRRGPAAHQGRRRE